MQRFIDGCFPNLRDLQLPTNAKIWLAQTLNQGFISHSICDVIFVHIVYYRQGTYIKVFHFMFLSRYRSRKDLDKTKCILHEKSVNDVMRTISSMINPFTVEQERLVSLASGFVLDDAIANRLLESEKRGEKQFVEFVRENLLSESPDIFVKLPRNNVTTFSTGKKVIVKDSKGKEINFKMNRDLFARLLLIAKHRKVDLELVLSYSLGTYPLSLATTSGSLVKTAKSKLFEILEGQFNNVTY